MKDTRFFWDASMDSSLYANRHHEDGTPFELETARIHEMTTKQVQLKNNREWGPSWSLIKGLTSGEYAMVHTGGNPGMNTIVILLSQSKRGIIVFTNGAKGDQLYERLTEEAFDLGREIITRMK